jgi:RimJ/RimL family protein N-acetyltransferase
MNDFETKVHLVFDFYKCSRNRPIPIIVGDETKGTLVPVTYYCRPEWVSLICKWRSDNQIGFANLFENTEEKTKNWIDNILLPRKDRILFMVYTMDSIPIGHLGFSSFNFETQSCEIDNVVRGEKAIKKGLMRFAMQTIMTWGKQELGLKDIYLKVLSHNWHAVRFYRHLGFKTLHSIPLYRVEKEDMISWEPMEDPGGRIPEQYFLYMKLEE